VQVTLQDGRVFTAKVQGRDPLTDVAVVQIEGQDLPTIQLGDSDQLQAGDWAIAIGNPLGLDSSATAGIISGIGRTASDIGALETRVAFLQTDAAINPGNSGGPLLNAAGEAIGVNSAIIRGAQSVGFAIPINQARRIADQLIQTGQVQHAFLGVRMRTVTPELLSQENLEVEQGAFIMEVLRDTPAERAGLQPGDVIIGVGDRAIRTVDQLQQQIEAAGVGQVLTLTIRRQAEELILEATTAVLPSQLAS
jgi:S1-C subfamily serine protease